MNFQCENEINSKGKHKTKLVVIVQWLLKQHHWSLALMELKIELALYGHHSKEGIRYVYPKGAYIVSLYCTLSFTLFTNGFANGPVLNKFFYRVSKIYYYWFLLLLLFPFIGLIGEMFSRLKLLNIGVVLIIVGRLYHHIAALFIDHESLFNIFLDAFVFVLSLFGIGLFITNIFQFGLDQFLFEPSDKLQSYIYFIFGMIVLSDIIICSFFAILIKFVEYAILHWLIVATFLVLSFLLVIFLVSMCYCKKYIHIEPPPQVSPVKHIYKVMKYAWLNKYPARRSTYTYTERPSRLDLCKERYGGPFTTDEVEEVKSFWRILLVLISMFGAYSLDTPIAIAEYCYHNKLNFSNNSYSHITPGLLVTVAYPELISIGSTFLCILIYITTNLCSTSVSIPTKTANQDGYGNVPSSLYIM